MLMAVVAVLVLVTGCVSRPPAAPATISDGRAPWSAPRDAVSHIEAAGLPSEPLGTDSDPWVLKVSIEADGEPVALPAFIGVDRLRAVQAPVHTHDSTGDVWLEGAGNRTVTLAQFFTLWGVRFADGCLGAYCTDLVVTADGAVVADPAALVLREAASVSISVRSG